MSTEQNSLKEFLDNIKGDSKYYPELRNYKSYVELLKNEQSALSKLVKRLIKNQPDRSKVDLACALAGATNLLAYRESGAKTAALGEDESLEELENRILANAREELWNDNNAKKDEDKGKVGAILDEFVKRYYDQLFELTTSRTNCPTIPQRIFPLATFLPKKGSIGVIELGCSRGDLGLALLNPGRLLRPKEEGAVSPYLFPEPSSEDIDRYI